MEAREWSGLWRTITGSIKCHNCGTVLPRDAEYGNGKHAMLNRDLKTGAGGLDVICDKCYVEATNEAKEDEVTTDRKENERKQRKRNSNGFYDIGN